MKNIIKTVSLLVFAVFFACSNNTTGSSASSPASTTPSSADQIGLAFSGTSESGKVEISLADDYLERVVDGNPYSVTLAPFGSPSLVKIIKTQVALTGFSYFGNSVDITCDMNDPANQLYLAFTGSSPSNPNIKFWFNGLNNDGLLYTIPASSGVQGPDDEIEDIYITDNAGDIVPAPTQDKKQVFFCTGSDGNDYNVTFHSDYDNPATGVGKQILSIFDVKEKVFTGIIEVVKRYSSEEPVQLYFK